MASGTKYSEKLVLSNVRQVSRNTCKIATFCVDRQDEGYYTVTAIK